MENNYELNAPMVELPNSTVILVLGIGAIVGCCCYGIVGIICGIIALVLAKTATNLYVTNPGRYTESSYKNVNTGKICAWIGLIPSVLYLLLVIWVIAAIGITGLSDPSAISNFFNNAIPQ